MNAEIAMGSALGFERAKRGEYRQPYSGPMVMKPLFTPREMDLMRELVRGDGGPGDKEIADRLGLTPGTVKVYMAMLMAKLKLPGRTALALYVERSGMFREDPERCGS